MIFFFKESKSKKIFFFGGGVEGWGVGEGGLAAGGASVSEFFQRIFI